MKLEKIDACRWRIPRHGRMRVDGLIIGSEPLMDGIKNDQSVQQVMNVAELPGILRYSLAMPDIHWGYGFPIGGVAAFDLDDGVISPGGVGYDINCGVRLLRSNLQADEIQDKIKELTTNMFHAVPSGIGSKSHYRVQERDFPQVLTRGAEFVVEAGYGTQDDLLFIEEGGRIAGASPHAVSDRAKQRGLAQVGSLGSGNHFVEIGRISEIYSPEGAAALHLFENQITVMIHCGSRGFGYQVCDDYLKTMNQAVQKYGIVLPDRQLCCAPLHSPEAKAYFQAMHCAINYAFANRQVISHFIRQVFEKTLRISPKQLGMDLVYDVSHNIAKIEEHQINGQTKRVCVHRKGATRAFPPNHQDIPEAYQKVGQPVFIPGDMGRYSFVLLGADGSMRDTFGSTCHGAGRVMSRRQSTRQSRNMSIVQEMERRGVFVQAESRRTMAEEMPHAYKDVELVVGAAQEAGISRKVAKIKPLGVIKG